MLTLEERDGGRETEPHKVLQRLDREGQRRLFHTHDIPRRQYDIALATPFRLAHRRFDHNRFPLIRTVADDADLVGDLEPPAAGRRDRVEQTERLAGCKLDFLGTSDQAHHVDRGGRAAFDEHRIAVSQAHIT